MDFTGPSGNQTFFPGDNVTFIAYTTVPGHDWKGSANAAVAAATITEMHFELYQSTLSDPNHGGIIAQSSSVTPTVVQNDANKVRYKITWDHKIPATVPPGTLYRIQAKFTCSAKPGVLGAKTQTIGENNYFSQLADVVSAIFAKGSVLGASTRTDQHADTFFPGATISQKTCTFIEFFFE
jgi:hypothetical protein